MKDRKAAKVAQMSLFRDCTAAELRLICGWADVIEVPAGCILAVEGTASREFVILVRGVAAATNGGSAVVLGRGSFFGHDTLIERGVHRATVTTLAPTQVMVFGVKEFRAALDRFPTMARAVLRDLSSRLRSATQDDRRLRAVS